MRIESRRQLLRYLAAFAGAVSTPSLLFAQGGRPAPQPRPSPNAPDPNVPQGLEGRGAPAPGTSAGDQRDAARQNALQIKEEVNKLYVLVSELKQEADLGTTASVLNLAFVKKAQQIEKLAKHVKDLAKG